MRSFDIVDEKIYEADFFYEQLAAVVPPRYDFRAVRFNFSAFVAAARSVTFALQASLTGAEGFSSWYAQWQDRLKADPLARFFHECRTDTQHIGINPVMGGISGPGHARYLFGQPEHGRYKYLPQEDVVTACRMHMRTVCTIVESCYRDFGLLIDPEQIYTVEGLRALGLTIEDVEEELGFPRGWSSYGPKGVDWEEQCIAALRAIVPKSGVKPVLMKYITEAHSD